MSKDSYAPGELIGLIRFVFDTTQSRTLNATQAYDSNPSQIVLASYPAKASIKAPAKSLGVGGSIGKVYDGTVLVNGAGYPKPGVILATGNKEGMAGLMKTVELAYGAYYPAFQAGSKQENEAYVFTQPGSTVNFAGIELLADGDLVAGSSKRKSTANKDIFYGAITVGTLLYKEWQGKYAVLKVDLLTNNAILRVYNR